MISDHELRQHVLDELDFEPSINATHIGVGVNGGRARHSTGQRR